MKRRESELTIEQEQEWRRALLLRARNGEAKAQAELMDLFGVRLYTKSERAKVQAHQPNRKSPKTVEKSKAR